MSPYIQLQHIVPLPLKDSIGRKPSELWDKEVSFAAGERVLILAPSGTGKTTLTHILYGLRQDYEGKATINGKEVKTQSAEQLAELRKDDISIVFQDMRLFPELSLADNLEVKRLLTNTISWQEVARWIARLGLSHKMHAKAGTLSFGEQQRVAIIRALLQPFRYLIMDEPFSHLDNANTQKAIALIQEVCDGNNAGFLLADLDENSYFPYTRTLQL